MASFSKFTDILAWQNARVLTKEIYLVTNAGEFKKDFGLKDQIRKSSVSIMANIAEGFGRRSDKEFKRFLEISLGSV
jgi:four helix bundle protein